MATTALVFLFVRKLIDPKAAWWCALLFAFEPFNVVNSTTMTNDVILACLTFAALGVFLIADRSADDRIARRRFAAAAVLLLAAFLVKITFLPVLCVMAGYSLIALWRSPGAVLPRHAAFYGTLLVGLMAVCLTYYALKGDLFWQFKSEAFYYQTYKPDWYLAGTIDYPALMWQYPRSLFGVSGYPDYAYREHGFLFWWVLPASVVVMLSRGNDILKLLTALAVVVFAFFQFYPQYLSPHYLPLVRQERYLEMLVPAAVILAGTTLWWLHRRHRVLAYAILVFLLADFVVQAARRSTLYDDSQEDVRQLAAYAASTVPAAGSRLAVDRPAQNALSFYLHGRGVIVEHVAAKGHRDVQQAYVAVGGARSFWWSRDEVLDVAPEEVPPHWILTYEVATRKRPWRPSNLRVYYVGEPPADWYPLFEAGQLHAAVWRHAWPDGNGVPGGLRSAGRDGRRRADHSGHRQLDSAARTEAGVERLAARRGRRVHVRIDLG